MKCICKYCNKEWKNPISLRCHERLCLENPNRQISNFVKYNKEKGSAWNKGLTKETDERVRRHAKILREGYKSGRLVSKNKGTHHTEVEKKHLSDMIKRYLKSHPDKIPYLLNHHSKQSYPERYFEIIFKSDEILKQFQKEYRVGLYSLDFAIPHLKFYLEIDGDQHYLDKRIVEHDKIRTEKLKELGWIGERIKWSKYRSSDLSERKKVIEELKNHIIDLQNMTP